MSNYLSESSMHDYVTNNPKLVTAKVQSNGLTVLKYRNNVFYKNLWTPELLECRGTVVDTSEPGLFKVVQRPFTKIFNYGENGTKIHRDATVTATRKVNGFMAAMSFHEDNPLVSTTGSCDSEFAQMARDMLATTGAYQLAEMNNHLTFIFEIVHPNDPHIIPDEVGVYLLGCRHKSWTAMQHYFDEYYLDMLARDFDMKRPEWMSLRFGDLVKLNKTVKHEGFVCWTDVGYELKLKSPHYLVTKFLARMRTDKLLKELETGSHGLKRRIDEEFYNVVDYVDSIKDEFAHMGEQDRIRVIRGFIESEVR